ncbi:hypothetical protein KM043_014792 [Ampulex compressa]|nr:hypothetical protein KM043_014792 [Ampulex compressa]
MTLTSRWKPREYGNAPLARLASIASAMDMPPVKRASPSLRGQPLQSRDLIVHENGPLNLEAGAKAKGASSLLCERLQRRRDAPLSLESGVKAKGASDVARIDLARKGCVVYGLWSF